MPNPNCDSCNYNENANIDVENLKLCGNCRCNTHKTNIRATILKVYPVSAENLKKIRSYCEDECNNRYFLIKDIEKFCINKYGSYAKYIEEKNNKAIGKKNLHENKEKDKINRKNELDTYLKRYGLRVRDDSIECYHYIEGRKFSTVTKDEVRRSMKILKFYCDHTIYEKLVIELKEKGIEKKRQNANYEFPAWFPWNQLEVIYRARKIALYDYIIKNYDNIKKCKVDVPDELMEDFNIFYENVRGKMETLDPECILKPSYKNNANPSISDGLYYKFKDLYQKNKKINFVRDADKDLKIKRKNESLD